MKLPTNQQVSKENGLSTCNAANPTAKTKDEPPAAVPSCDPYAWVERYVPDNVVPFWRVPREEKAAGTTLAPPPRSRTDHLSHVCRLGQDSASQQMARRYGLSVVDAAWEDMARDKHSSFGHRMTDLSLKAHGFHRPCSIVRKPNFSDHTGDFDISQFNIKVGNEAGRSLHTEPLRDYVNRILVSDGSCQPAVIPPSHEVLVSAQSCLLPLAEGHVDFNVEQYSYQARKPYASSLTVLSSVDGTSAQFVTSAGRTSLCYNRDGTSLPFSAERLKAVRVREGRPEEGPVSAEEEQKKLLLIFQIPLKVPTPKDPLTSFPENLYLPMSGASASSRASYDFAPGSSARPNYALGASTGSSYAAGAAWMGTDHAQVGVSKTGKSGIFTSYKHPIIFDPSAAIRCTVQHYLVTDRPTLLESDMAEMAKAIEDVYQGAKRQGSLVTDADAISRATAPNLALAEGYRQSRPWYLQTR